MPHACIVVISSQHHLDAVRERTSADGNVLAFSEKEAVAAFEAIIERQPQVVTLERLFAATSRGAALINRIKADPALIAIEIRVVSHDGQYSRVSHRRNPPRAAAAAGDASVAVAEAAPELDWRGTRRAPRHRMAAATEAQVDGTTAVLLDLSALGAQIVAEIALKPGQRVRMGLSDAAGAERFRGAVVWVAVENPQGVTRYRAGIEFDDARRDAVEAFAKRHRG
jgi:hypothetical protein